MKNAFLDCNTKIRLSADIYASEIAGEAVILEKKQGIYYGLNPSGLIIFRHLKEPISLLEIRNLLLEKYDAEPNNLENIIQAFVEKMLAAKIITTIDE